MLWVVDRPEIHGAAEMIEKFSRELSGWELMATLDAGQARCIDAESSGNVGKSFVPGKTCLAQIHGCGVCVIRKFRSTDRFAPGALCGAIGRREIAGDMEATQRAEAQRRGVGWAIRQLREAQKKTLEDVANAIGTDAGNLSRVEIRGQQLPEPMLFAVAEQLGVSVSELYRIAESGDEGLAAVMAKAAQMDGPAIKELDTFADFLLNRSQPLK